MKPEDIEFVRKIAAYDYSALTFIGRLFFLLIESEAMREKAEFWVKHQGWRENETCRECGMTNLRHKWLDADWIAAKKRELGI